MPDIEAAGGGSGGALAAMLTLPQENVSTHVATLQLWAVFMLAVIVTAVVAFWLGFLVGVRRRRAGRRRDADEE